MNSSRVRGTIALAALTLLSVGITGCASSAPEPAGTEARPSTEASTPAPEPTSEPEPAPDLEGEWKQTNSNSDDSYQSATIAAGTIEVHWVSSDTKSLYWAGTFQAPTEAGAFSWESANDTAKTEGAMLASGDSTKIFTYDNGEISYEVSAMGTTMTVRLER